VENFTFSLQQDELQKIERGEVKRDFSLFAVRHILSFITNIKYLLAECETPQFEGCSRARLGHHHRSVLKAGSQYTIHNLVYIRHWLQHYAKETTVCACTGTFNETI
jgi:hypothetical protein